MWACEQEWSCWSYTGSCELDWILETQQGQSSGHLQEQYTLLTTEPSLPALGGLLKVPLLCAPLYSS